MSEITRCKTCEGSGRLYTLSEDELPRMVELKCERCDGTGLEPESKETTMPDKDQEKIGMISKFLCPGCSCGPEPGSCECFRIKDEVDGDFTCSGHSAGTFMSGVGRIALGLPKGFCRYGGAVPPSHLEDKKSGSDQINTKLMYIRLHLSGETTGYNHLNVPVWAMVEDGYLFVRTFSPRVNRTCVDIVKGGTLEMVPQAIDVSKFIGEID